MLVFAGVALTIVLAFLSVARVSPDGISYRKPVVWSNGSTLVLTQPGSPELRSVLPVARSSGVPTLAGTDRFVGLVELYAAMATSDEVVRLMQKRGLLSARERRSEHLPFSASPVKSSLDTPYVNGGILPVISISARGASPAAATRLATGATKAFLDVLRQRQANAKIPPNARIEVSVLKRSGEPALVEPRSKMLPMMIVLGGLIATIAAAFARDNNSRRQTADRITTAGRVATALPTGLIEVVDPSAVSDAGSPRNGGQRRVAAVDSKRNSTLGKVISGPVDPSDSVAAAQGGAPSE